MIISVCVKNGEQGLTSASLGSLLAAAPGLFRFAAFGEKHD